MSSELPHHGVFVVAQDLNTVVSFGVLLFDRLCNDESALLAKRVLLLLT